MKIADKYVPQELEGKWYDYWLAGGYFHSEPDSRPSYTIVIPPPNVTGMLHMGHMLNNTLQDVLVRRARMNGMNACWVPGTDHASIATEAMPGSGRRSTGGLSSNSSAGWALRAIGSVPHSRWTRCVRAASFASSWISITKD